jgi:hypothetical protein
MSDLKILREQWEEIQKEEAKLSSSLSIQESVRQFFELYQIFALQLTETEAIFGPERRAYLVDLQQRLQRIAEWQRLHARESNPD